METNSVPFDIFGIPEKPINLSWEEFFRQKFPFNTMLDEMLVETQFNFLYRQYLLCKNSNRADELETENPEDLSECLTVRNSSGVMCHPIFLKQSTFETEFEDMNQAEGVALDLAFDEWCKRTGHPKKMHFYEGRDVIVPLLFVADLMEKCFMVTRDSFEYRREKAYPERFHHGDILKLVVVDTIDSETTTKRVNGFYRNDGTYIWLKTNKHPLGYPHALSPVPDEYGCVPYIVKFGGNGIMPDAYYCHITHNTVCNPSDSIITSMISNISFIDLGTLIERVHVAEESIANMSNGGNGDPRIKSNLDSSFLRMAITPDTSKSISAPYSSFTDPSNRNISYAVFFEGFEKIKLGWNPSVINEHIKRNLISKGWCVFAGKVTSSVKGLTHTIYYLVVMNCIDAEELEKECIGDVEIAKAYVSQYTRKRSLEVDLHMQDAKTRDELCDVHRRSKESGTLQFYLDGHA